MHGEGRIPPLLVAGLVVVVLAIGVLAYYAGRFGRSEEGPVSNSTVELPPPGPPDPAVAQSIPMPAEVPPTVTPSAQVVIEKATRSSRVLVERSSQIDVPVPAVIPTAAVRAAAPTPIPTPRRPIVVQIVSTPMPTPTLQDAEPDEVEPEEIEEEDVPPLYTTPQPEPTPGRSVLRGRPYGGGRPASIWSFGRPIAFSLRPRSTQTKHALKTFS